MQRMMHGQALVFDIPEVAKASDDAFGRIVRERGAVLLRVAYRMVGNWADAEDVVQDAFLRLHRHGLKFSCAEVLNAWLYRVVVNLCVDRRRRVRPEGELFDLAHSSRSAEADLLLDEQKRHLQNALRLLPPRERAVVVLRQIEGLSTAEVAHIFGTTEVTVRSQISSGIGKLRKILAKENL